MKQNMTFFPDNYTLVRFGVFSVPWYAVSLIAGVIAAYFMITKRMKKHGYSLDTSDELLIMCMIGGVLGGRIFWILENLKYYTSYLPYIFAVSDGGFDVLGMIVGICVIVYVYTQRRLMSILRTMDVLMPAVMVFAIITRAGKAFANPRILLVSLCDLVGLAAIWFLIRPYRDGRRRGDVTTLSMMWMGLTKLLAIVFSLDTTGAGSLLLAVLFELFGVALYIIVHRRRPTKPIILFDLDGTLMDSKKMVLQCFTYLFRKYGDVRDFTPEKQKEVFGPPLKEEMKRLFPDQDPDAMVDEYRKYQSSFSWSDSVSLFPGVKGTLDLLWKEGYVLGIVSSRLTSSCESWVRQLGLSYCFGAILGRDLYENPKPKPDGILYAGKKLKRGHDSCIYVGDNAADIEAAKAAGVYAVAYLTDFSKRTEVEEAKPNRVITSIAELLDILKEDHEFSYEQV